jgi:nitric oxide reductase activation protein
MPAFEDNVKRERVVWTFCICMLFAMQSGAQSHPYPGTGAPQGAQNPSIIPTDPSIEANSDDAQRRATKEMEKKANLERQAALRKDTEKLLQLAEELKSSVDKSSASVLSIDVVRKAEQIEKLAHSVKDKMKGSN